jgi:hypothetical protein
MNGVVNPEFVLVDCWVVLLFFFLVVGWCCRAIFASVLVFDAVCSE